VSHSNPYVNALAGDSWWDVGRNNIITYNMAADYGFAWTVTERAAFEAVFRAYEAVCDVQFVGVSRAAAEIVQNKITTDLVQEVRPWPQTWHGWHDYPGSGQRHGFYDFTHDYWPISLAPGGKAFWLILHEIGHALGLDHPQTTTSGTGLFPGVSEGDASDPGNHGLNSVRTTVVSNILTKSNSVATGQVVGPMAFDIAALQAMYGAVPAATGANEYRLGAPYWRCLWDTGGTDWITSSSSRSATIDLRPASLQDAPGGGGWFSSVSGINGGFSIAHGVTIENARGGNGHDIITGNSARNILDGRGGNDRIMAGDGHDALTGGVGNDRLICASGNDLARGGVGDDRIDGGLGADFLFGDGGIDSLYLGIDSNRDRVVARQGDRIYQFDSGEDKIDLSGLDVDWIWYGRQGAGWAVTVDYDADPAHDIEFFVFGEGPRMSDFLF
jgi:serralysin